MERKYIDSLPTCWSLVNKLRRDYERGEHTENIVWLPDIDFEQTSQL